MKALSSLMFFLAATGFGLALLGVLNFPQGFLTFVAEVILGAAVGACVLAGFIALLEHIREGDGR